MASVRDEPDIDTAVPTGDPKIDALLGEYDWSKLARNTFLPVFSQGADDCKDTRVGVIDDHPEVAHGCVSRVPIHFIRAVRQMVEAADGVVDRPKARVLEPLSGRARPRPRRIWIGRTASATAPLDPRQLIGGWS